MRTTRPRPFDMEERYPFLAARRRTATRLHPRPGNPGVTDSSVGGPLLWPADEAWPVCEDTDHYDDPHMTVADVRRERLVEATRSLGAKRGDDVAALEAELKTFWEKRGKLPAETPQRFVGVAQLFARDVPDLPRPAGTDLLQVLWCPYMHADAVFLPSVRVVWRDSAAVGEVIDDPTPQVVVGDEGFVPESCTVWPETVVEYPPAEWWGETLAADLDDDEHEAAIADGWKVGGWGGYCGVTDPVIPDCACGAPTEPLFTVGNGEWSNGYPLWRPVEDDAFTRTPEHFTDWDPVRTYIGRGYLLQVFRCTTGFDCPPTVAMT
ncbi:hypothetical protein LX16_2679 [Stackebrandtia albiflava]|uniref:DUF1963 domain-containing protein n=1 Tax=Stackebrandtia albiflava TaxID=406432 RepID=A0A562V2A1_9ACTN|nr:hypothetical protein [Stackebrandtia albiflava]TWJ11937.1 hypothetical protein LX16_2679 [Stackebrandtia albiflava]